MGLDMYAHARKNAPEDCPWFGDGSDFDAGIAGEKTDCTIDEPYYHGEPPEHFAYWRKHADLHRWMERLAIERGFKGSFNCVWLRLTPQDLDRLQTDMNEGLEKNVGGFFFGQSEPEDDEYTRRFIKGARYAFRQGVTIFYDSWW